MHHFIQNESHLMQKCFFNFVVHIRLLSEEDIARIRAVNCRVADRALLVLDLRLVMKARCLRRELFLNTGVAL